MNFHPTTQKSKYLFLMGYFCPQYTGFSHKNIEKVFFMTLNSDTKFE